MRLALLMTIFLALSGAAHAQDGTEAQRPRMSNALFAGGSFWAMEQPFEDIEGVIDVKAGYAGGGTPNPTRKQVESGVTGHMEVVQVTYDPTRVMFPTLLEVYWRNIDPFNTAGQFCEEGDPYKSAVFVDGPKERKVAEASRDAVRDRFAQPVATDIRDAKAAIFYTAEPDNQNFIARHPIRYRLYEMGCKRDKRLIEIWGDEAGGYHIGKRKAVAE